MSALECSFWIFFAVMAITCVITYHGKSMRTESSKHFPRGLFGLAVLECGAELLKVDEWAERDLTLWGPAECAKFVCAGELFLQCKVFCPNRGRCPIVNQLSKPNGYDFPVALGRLRVIKADGVDHYGNPQWVFDAETENAKALVKGMAFQNRYGLLVLSRLQPAFETKNPADNSDQVAEDPERGVDILKS